MANINLMVDYEAIEVSKEDEERIRKKGGHLININYPNGVIININYKMAPKGYKILFDVITHRERPVTCISVLGSNYNDIIESSFEIDEKGIDDNIQVLKYRGYFIMPDHDVLIEIYTGNK